MKPLIRKILVVLVAILVVALSMWLTGTDSVWAVRAKDTLCVLDLEGGRSKVAMSFTTSQTLERFFVNARPEKRGERLFLTITKEKSLLCSSAITKPKRFGFSPGEIPPGTYKAVLKQETGSQGGRVIISARELGLTGWQILSRTLAVLLVVSGVWAGVSRKSKNRRQHVTSFFIFHSLLLTFVLIFIYLLFHEGGHALGASIFGECDWARSDFWGIHGIPQ